VTAPAARLEVFANPAPGRDYEIVHTHHEFTSLCPLTGHPDFAALTVRYVPDRTCVELKSLKLYLHGYRQQGVFFEALVNRILDDLVGALSPRRLEVEGAFRGRGGITTTVVARHPGPRAGTSA
jgi:7-cyano-7-deazaguanine reductase